MRRSSELNDFDRTSLLKSMTDIKTFTFQQRRLMLDQILNALEDPSNKQHYQLKDLNHILLAYFTDPKLFEDKLEQVGKVFEKVTDLIESG